MNVSSHAPSVAQTPAKSPAATPVPALPAKYYTDPEIFEKTRRRIFETSWQYVCHHTRLPETGDYHAFTLMDQDLFVIRGRDGKLRCFYNVCQHRGHTLVEDSGRARVLVCPYHAWTYELEGPLRSAPGAKEAGFDPASVCLTEVGLDVFLGFVFVNLDPGARPMEALYPGVREAVLELCPDIENARPAHEHRAEEFCNWLVAVENYNECYHCRHVHKAFAAGVIDPDSYDIQPFGAGRCLNHRSKPALGDARWHDAGGSDYGSFFLYPLFSLQIYPGSVVNTYFWRPVSCANTVVHRGWFSEDGNVDDALQRVIDNDRETTFAEDLVLVKNVQRGLGSRGYRPGSLVIRPGHGIDSEHSIAALHRWVREDLDD